MEGGHREDSQTSQHALGGPAGHGEEALGVWELAALQAGQITPQPEQIQVQLLQVLLPLLDLVTAAQSGVTHAVLLVTLLVSVLTDSYFLNSSLQAFKEIQAD